MNKTEKRIEKKAGEIAIYKPNNRGTGSVAQFKIKLPEKNCLFIELAKQIRPKEDSKPYDWDNKIVVKLGTADITKILAYLSSQLLYFRSSPDPLKLFHKTSKGSKTIELKWQSNEYKGKKQYSYYLTVSSKDNDGDPHRVSVPIGLDEAEYVKVGLKRALEIFLNW